jgi:formylmethanofuran dehydrogenase subunit D
LGVKDGKNVKVTTKFGSVVLRAKENTENPGGIAFVPMGPWANAIIDPSTGGCGMPGFKGIDAEVSATNEQVLSVVQLLGGKSK